jgi:hypothetical protein
VTAALDRGDRVELAAASYDDVRFGLTAGDRGTVEFIDSLGTVLSGGTTASGSGSSPIPLP